MNIILYFTVLPPLFLMYQIYKMDKVEREPFGLVAKVFILGMLSCIPAGIMESIMIGALSYVIDVESLIGIAVENFLVVAVCEEFVKMQAAKSQTWKNPEFNYLFDGIVYCAAASLGFALFENVFYVLGSDTAFFIAAIRSVTSIPGHCAFGIMMGYYYGLSKYYLLHGDSRRSRSSMKQAFWVPVFLHGLYDFILSLDFELLALFFIIYVIWMDVRAIRRVKQMSAADEPLGPSYNPQDMYPPQGNYPPQGGYPPQRNYPQQGQYPQQGNYPPQGQYPQQGNYPPQGNNTPQGRYPQQGGNYNPDGDPFRRN